MSDELSQMESLRLKRGDALAKIDQYELIRELGGGGFGTVYLAKDAISGVEYAVKGLPPEVKNSLEEQENIRANFKLVSRLSHTNIARAYVLHPAKSVWYASEEVRQKLRVLSGDTLMVMEYAPGTTLSKWRRQFPEGKAPEEQALEIVRQIADALDYAHGQKIIHRDIKPSNVMIETKKDGRLVARVLDFGLAAEIRSSMGRVSREVRDVSGTRPYMAPEQWLGEKQTAATDQYALAALCHELLTGAAPFASVFETGDVALMERAVTARPAAVPRELPRRIRYALGKALAKKPQERFASCGEFVAALAGRAKGKGGVKALLAAACLAALAAGAFLLFRPATHPGGATSLSPTGQMPFPSPAPVSSVRPETDGKPQTFTLPGGVQMEMVYVGPGSFQMGSESGNDDEKPVHQVRLTKGYWIGKYPVTQRQWAALVSANGVSFAEGAPAACFSASGKGSSAVSGMDTSEFPMESVSWEDCDALVKALNRNEKGGRTWSLPTEAQWEFAARGGNKSRGYTYSGGDDLDALGWYYENSGIRRLDEINWDVAKLDSNKCRTHSVREKDVGNELGIVGMSGNVWEWCYDWYNEDYYSRSPEVDPCNRASGTLRVLRGGSWFDLAVFCRSAGRSWSVPGLRNWYYGFRLVCSAGLRDSETE